MSLLGAFVGVPLFGVTPGVVGMFGAATIEGLRPALLLASPAFAGLVAIAFVSIIAANAVFVASEASLSQLKPAMAAAYKSDEKLGAKLEYLAANRDDLIAGAFMGSQTMRAWLFLLCLLPAYAIADFQTAEGSVPPISSVLLWMIGLSIPIAGINILVGELIPKSYAQAYPAPVAGKLYPIIRVAAAIFWIPANLAKRVADMVTKKAGAEATFAPLAQVEEEIKSIIENYGDSGQIDQEEVEMLDSVFDFGDTIAREIMTPRVDVDSISVDSTVEEAAKLIDETGHSRLPVFQGTDDQILGIVHAKDLMMAVLSGGGQKTLRQVGLRKAVAVPENRRLHDLLDDMRSNKVQLVIIQDEFGGTAGIVTIEDLVEEVMGEIVDEYDDEEPSVIRDGEGYIVDARLHLDDVNKAIGTSLSDEEFDTLGGFVFGLFGRQPSKGEEVTNRGCEFKVIETSGKRILKVRVEQKLDQDDPLFMQVG